MKKEIIDDLRTIAKTLEDNNSADLNWMDIVQELTKILNDIVQDLDSNAWPDHLSD